MMRELSMILLWEKGFTTSTKVFSFSSNVVKIEWAPAESLLWR